MLYGDLKITDDSVFYQMGMDALNNLNNQKMVAVAARVKQAISSIMLKALNESPTVQSLLSGTLKDDFGLYGNVVQSTINNIVNYISNNIKISIETIKQGKKTKAKVTIDILPSSFKEVSKLPEGSFKSENNKKVNWLDWLLNKGSQVVVGDFRIYEPALGKTRSSGKKVMIKIGKTPREPFRVDPSHSGTPTDNFITRALESIYDDIIDIIAAEIIKGI